MFNSLLIKAVAVVAVASTVAIGFDWSKTTEEIDNQVKSSELYTDHNNMIVNGFMTETTVNRMTIVQNTTKIDVIEKLKSINIETATDEEIIAVLTSSKEVSKVLSQMNKDELDELDIKVAALVEEYKNISVSVDELPKTEQDIYDLNSEITKDL